MKRFLFAMIAIGLLKGTDASSQERRQFVPVPPDSSACEFGDQAWVRRDQVELCLQELQGRGASQGLPTERFGGEARAENRPLREFGERPFESDRRLGAPPFDEERRSFRFEQRRDDSGERRERDLPQRRDWSEPRTYRFEMRPQPRERTQRLQEI
jgi:hypothetical protein